MPLFGLGTWRSKPGEVRSAVSDALTAGYQHIDAAWIYQNQTEVGQGLKDAIAASGGKLKREDIFITSKVWNHHQAPANVEVSIRETLSQLEVDYLDLLLLHWPTPWRESWPEQKEVDTSFTREDTWRALEKLVEQKLVRSIGVSNFQIEEIEAIFKFAKIKPVVNQVELHPYFNQDKLRAWSKSNGIHITSYCPLGNLGNLNEPASSRANSIAAELKIDPSELVPLKDPVILEIANKKGKSPAQVIIRWNLQLGLTVIPKSVKKERLIENAAVYDFELSEEEIKAINGLSGDQKRIRFVNPLFRTGNKETFPNDFQSH